MATLLLVVIYISFIGLGIPDSLFGAAWPAIYGEFSLPISFGSFVTVTISCCTVVSSVLSSRVIGRFGTNKVSAVSTALTALGLFGFSCAGSFPWLILCAIPLGLGAGAIDTALNNYVALHYSATHMSFLHCFYGVGVSLSPYILSLVISGPAGWRGGYRVALCIQLCITALMFLTLPVWAKAHGKESGGGEGRRLRSFAHPGGAAHPRWKGMCLLFITSVGIDTTCGTWGSTFLVEYKHMAADQAAGMVTFYYIGMALGRFLSGVLASRLHSWKIIRLGQWGAGRGGGGAVAARPGHGLRSGIVFGGIGQRPAVPQLQLPYPGELRPPALPVRHGGADGLLLCGLHGHPYPLRGAGPADHRGAAAPLPAGVLCGDGPGHLEGKAHFACALLKEKRQLPGISGGCLF